MPTTKHIIPADAWRHRLTAARERQFTELLGNLVSLTVRQAEVKLRAAGAPAELFDCLEDAAERAGLVDGRPYVMVKQRGSFVKVSTLTGDQLAGAGNEVGSTS